MGKTAIIMGGAAGRMGQMILRCALEDENFTVAGGLEAPDSPWTGKTVGQMLGNPEACSAPVAARMEDIPDAAQAVAIHFSAPGPTLEAVEWAAAQKAPVVIGTTGLEKPQIGELERAAQEIPIVFAPNMSVGVNTLFQLVSRVAKALGPEFDVEITEMHHRFKKDAPSGTARRLGELVAEGRGGTYEELVVDGRSGMPGARPAGEIGMHALRGGDVVGEHTVSFTTLGERLELTHKAHSRETFARGSLRAAQWLQGKAAGLFDMQDVLGLKD